MIYPLHKRLKQFSRQHALRQNIVELDYLLSWLIASIAQDPIIGPGLIFKGGTALKKCYFNQYRFSENLDFTAQNNIPQGNELFNRMKIVTKRAEIAMNEFAPITLTCERYIEKQTHPDNQEAFRIRARFPNQREPLVSAMIEITFSERLLYAPLLQPIFHPYGEVIEQQVKVYSLEEIIIEKLRGILQHTKKLHERGWTRSRTRDYYDLYHLFLHDNKVLNDKKLLIYLSLKCLDKGVLFRELNDFFDPLFIKEVEKNWQQHLGYLLEHLPPIEEVFDILKKNISSLLAQQLSLGQILGCSEYHHFLKGKDLFDFCRFRLMQGANPNDTQNKGHRPLQLALNNHLKDIAFLLLENGADMCKKDASNLSAFEWALTCKLYDIAHEMHKRGHPYTPRHPNSHLKVPFHCLFEFEQLYF